MCFPVLILLVSAMPSAWTQEALLPETGGAKGLAATAWPKFGGNARNTGLSKSKSTPGKPWIRETPNKGMFHSPALDEDGTLYIGADTLYALEGNTGKKKWEFNTGVGFAGSTVIGANGLLYTGNYNYVYAIDKRTGKKRWRFESKRDINSNPTVGADGTVYIIGSDKTLHALDGGTGREKWTYATHGMGFYAPTLDAEGTVYFISDKVYALNAADGSVKWDFDAEGQTPLGSPALNDGVLYFGTAGKKEGTVIALDTATGKPKWKFVTPKFVQSSPSLGADGTLYIGCGDGSVYALNSADGTLKWTFKTGKDVASSPAVGADGTVFVGSFDGKFYALNGKTGAKRWDYQTGDRIFCSPILGNNGLVYFSSFDGRIYALRQEDGTGPPADN